MIGKAPEDKKGYKERFGMPREELVQLIENSADELTNKWLAAVKKNPSTPTYSEFPEDILYKRAFNCYAQLGYWISHNTTKEEISRNYTALGAKRFQEGFALHEVISSLLLIKKEIWDKILAEKSFQDVLDLSTVFNLSRRIAQFFDRALYFTVCGYEEESRKDDIKSCTYMRY